MTIQARRSKGTTMHTAVIAAIALTLASASVAGAQGRPGAHFIENWDLNADGTVTVEEAAERRSDVFASFDANDDGFLDAEEYILFDQARAQDQAENEPAGFGRGRRSPADGMKLEVNDIDGDGKVSKDEFIGNAAAWVTDIDRDGDGAITIADFGPRK